MANYDFTYRTNYFRVKDEDAYQEFIKHIRNISPDEDFSEIKDGIVWHGMGGYDCTPEYIDLPLETKTIKNVLENDEKFYDRNHNLIPETGKTLNDYELKSYMTSMTHTKMPVSTDFSTNYKSCYRMTTVSYIWNQVTKN